MNKPLLQKHIKIFLDRLSNDPKTTKLDIIERKKRINYYQSWTKDRILEMKEEDLLEYLSKPWAMIIWGNKQYFVDKLIADNGFAYIKNELSELIYGEKSIEIRWDNAYKKIKGFGPALQSELLCHVYPEKYILWNKKTLRGFSFLGVEGLPKSNYQLTGKKYMELSKVAIEIAHEMKTLGATDTSLLSVNYFIWDELQIETSTTNAIHQSEIPSVKTLTNEESKFVHNEIRDKLRDIGQWLGFNAKIETKVAHGSVVDTVWESVIGNMGRVLYVFEVQTKGSIDSLILNLLKAKNNSAVQGVVAVSDKIQIEKIKKHSAEVQGLKDIKFWDYEEVVKVHESLEFVNSTINNLKLVPDGF